MPQLRRTATRRRLDARTIRAAVCEQLETTLNQLNASELSDQDIHNARKCIKKTRAMLRLLRDVLTAQTYRRENAALRNAARPLSATRDAKVLIDAVDALVAKKVVSKHSVDALRTALLNDRARLQRRVVSRRSVARSRQALRTVHTRAARWPLARDDGLLLIHALRRTYKRARRGMSAARDEPTAENLHEWRKQVKYLWHEMQMLEPLRPGEVGELASRLHKLSDHLGDDHDLAVLCGKVHAHPEAMTKAAARKVRHCIDEQRAALQEKAFALGKRLFADSPTEFAQRFARLLRKNRSRALRTANGSARRTTTRRTSARQSAIRRNTTRRLNARRSNARSNARSTARRSAISPSATHAGLH
jgi:CHAD domain-containing protein